MIDFTIAPEHELMRKRVADFVEEDVRPAEADAADTSWDDARIDALRERARARGLWNPHLPAEWGGMGLSALGMALVHEALGSTLLGAQALNCAPPNEGNMLLLLGAAAPEQRERYLRPLAAGRTRSCFAMTERGAGSDPSKLKTRAVRDGGEWVLDGEKWYTGGAVGADFAVVAAITNPREPARGITLFLVDCATPGWQVVRQIPSMGTRLPGGSCEVRLNGCRVPAKAVLGSEGEGLTLIQGRLGRARLSHCMRWVGVCQHALDLASQRALARETFGSPLAQHQAVQLMLADSAIDLYASRLMVLHNAWLLDHAQTHQQEVNMAKVFVSEALGRVVDRALQIHGSLGYSADLPLERYYRDARGARIYDGPSEVLRAAIAFQLLKTAAREKSARGACGPVY